MKDRILTDHKVNPANDTLTIRVLDEPGSGGANHLYVIEGFDSSTNASNVYRPLEGRQSLHAAIVFQNGPIGTCGVNGVTQEALLAIVADRLRSFQAGPCSCRENAMALAKVEEAMLWLHKRTLDRMRRNVEGTNAV